MLEINNKKLHDWIVEKDKLVGEGRKVSQELENL